MKQRSALEVALVATLVPLWLLCFVLHVDLLLREDLAWMPLYVAPAASAAGHPEVTGFWPETPADSTTLRVGDRLLGVGELSLRGAGRLGVLSGVYETVSEEGIAAC